ncbi:hypothetical protein RGR602_PB00479 (plasmid) [Rhizobium gallicum bv. gallicum R602sp]|uniref:PilZ domain-containing protein n=1 Tax=Rhizobium gallicum bv. gallicum R602sp TaxID=1041138 RepID=A0A0B4XBN1_9HYPH|nr:hypothetical protein RGR602_PB00479 [Rhizobium gallicum bv. gallicum R602sp]
MRSACLQNGLKFMPSTAPRDRVQSTYLSRLAADLRTSARLKRNCRFMVRLVYPARALRNLTMTKALVVEVSENGARIRTSCSTVPDHFYIVLGNYEYFIGVTAFRRSTGEIEVEFIKEQPTRFINALSRIEFPLATIHDLKRVLEV